MYDFLPWFCLANAQPPAVAWWSQEAAALVGGIAGTLAGIYGAATGVVGGVFRAYAATIVMAGAAIAVGAVLLVAGVVAVVLGQPYEVYYPLLLMGGVLMLTYGFLLPLMRRRWREQYLAGPPTQQTA